MSGSGAKRAFIDEFENDNKRQNALEIDRHIPGGLTEPACFEPSSCLPFVTALCRRPHAEDAAPVQPFYFRRYSVGSDLRDRGGNREFPFIAGGTFVAHRLQSWLAAWIMMLPVVVFAAPGIRNLTHVLTRQD